MSNNPIIRIVRFLFSIPIVIYQRVLSPFIPSSCNYYPSCSEYSRQAILRFGIVRGALAGALRIGRCSARYWGGNDPLPERFDLSQLVGEYRARSVRRAKLSQRGKNVELSLAEVKSGLEVEVVRFDGGEGFRSKVIAMGIIPGKRIKVQSYSTRGPMVAVVEGSRVALGRELARRIVVREAPASSEPSGP